jgi:hypothetical protein
MKKLLIALLSLAVFVAVVSSKAQAFEGELTLSGADVSCKGSSVWHESRYRVIGRCEGLVYPYETQYEYYTLWAHDVSRDAYVRIDDVDRGYFEGDVNSAFDKLLITAETDGGPRRPSDKTVATGSINKFAFDKSEVVQTDTKNTVTEATTDANKSMTVQTTTNKATTASSAGSVAGRIITSLLVILLVVVGIVIAGSLLFRSRGSVSH